MVGDSTALTLSVGLSYDAARYGARLVEKGSSGVASRWCPRSGRPVSMPPWWRACNPATPAAGQWPALWTGWIERYHPTVVAILAGRWEVSTVEWKGRWTDILDPGLRRLRPAATPAGRRRGLVGGRRGGALHRPLLRQRRAIRRGAMARGPTRPPERLQRTRAPGGRGQPAAGDTDQPRRPRVPGGTFESQIDGVTVRAPDGVHFPFAYRPGEPAAPCSEHRRRR